MKIKKGDTVQIITGNNAGKTGRVINDAGVVSRVCVKTGEVLGA